MSSQIKNTQVNLDGLLEVLGQNLYSTPAVALRELIQNAHDACRRFQLESGKSKNFQIDLCTDPDRNVLVIRDNGSGLTCDEVSDYLATIGSGYTRILRERTATDDMIGYFGLGFLSAYVVANKVEVYTTSYQAPDETWLFTSVGGKTFSISEAVLHPVGSKIVLRLKSGFSGLSDEAVVSALIRKYCSLLPIPITLNESPEPINNVTPPWIDREGVSYLQQKRRQLAFAELFEADYSPLACIKLPENDLDLEGLLWIQDGSSYLSSDSRNVNVFIRNMFITDKEADLLPRWAGFVGMVLESPRFKPTASRESLQEEEYYKRAREFIREVLVTGLRDLVLQEPETWARILVRHNQALIGAAVVDDRLFEATKRSIKLPTNNGDFTAPQLVKKSGGTLYLKPEVAASSEDMLLAAQGIPLIKGYLYAVSAYCQKFSQMERVPLRNLGMGADQEQLLRRVTVSKGVEERLTALFSEDDVEVRFAEYEPGEVPLVYFSNREAILKNRIESDEAASRISSAALSLARLHASTLKQQKERVVYVNLLNPVIQKLSSMEGALTREFANVVKCCVAGVQDGDEKDDSVLTRLSTFSVSMLTMMEQ